jgi:hypothetical protein
VGDEEKKFYNSEKQPILNRLCPDITTPDSINGEAEEFSITETD